MTPHSADRSGHQSGMAAERFAGDAPLNIELRLVISEQNGYAVVAVHGELDASNASVLRQQLIELSDLGHRQVVVDLESTTFLDPTGLGVLVGGLRRLQSQQGDLSLVCPLSRIPKVFNLTGLEKVFTIHPSTAAAIAARAE